MKTNLTRDEILFLDSIRKKRNISSVSKRAITLAKQTDCDLRQCPMKDFNAVGRQDYSFKKQLNRIDSLGFRGEERRRLIDKIDETNSFEIARSSQ